MRDRDEPAAAVVGEGVAEEARDAAAEVEGDRDVVVGSGDRGVGGAAAGELVALVVEREAGVGVQGAQGVVVVGLDFDAAGRLREAVEIVVVEGVRAVGIGHLRGVAGGVVGRRVAALDRVAVVAAGGQASFVVVLLGAYEAAGIVDFDVATERVVEER